MTSVFLQKNHLILRDPNGSDGNVAAMKAAGFGLILCNIRDFPPSSWDPVRQRAREAGVPCGPWGRTAAGSAWDETMLQTLVQVADEWGSPLLVNSEKELDGSGDYLTRHIAEVCSDRDYALSMEAWPYANVDWTPLADVPVCPQIFPAESETASDPDGCRAEWHRRGISCVVFTFGAYGGQGPHMFDRLSPFGVYTGDDCAGQYGNWKPLGTHDPCAAQSAPTPEDEMDQVTDQQARDSVVFAVQATAQNWTQEKPKARLTVARRICAAGNDDGRWNSCRDEIVAALNRVGIPA